MKNCEQIRQTWYSNDPRLCFHIWRMVNMKPVNPRFRNSLRGGTYFIFGTPVLKKKHQNHNRTMSFKLFFSLNCSVSDPDPVGSVSYPYQETLIWIRVVPKINQNHGINKSKWFVNVLFTCRKFFKIIFNNLMFTFI